MTQAPRPRVGSALFALAVLAAGCPSGAPSAPPSTSGGGGAGPADSSTPHPGDTTSVAGGGGATAVGGGGSSTASGGGAGSGSSTSVGGGGSSGGTSSGDTSSGGGPPAPVLPPPPEWIGATHGLVKLRPGDPLPAAKVVSIEAAKNETEPFQIVFSGGAAGRTVQGVTPSKLVGPGGAEIAPGQLVVYRAGLFNVPSPSNAEGAAGPWPDPLIPDVDPYYHEKRGAFPMVVPAGEIRSAWVEVLVPPDAPAGQYQGELTIDTSGGAFAMPLKLRVRGFSLPSTGSLRTAFAGFYAESCEAHHGSYEACGQEIGGSPDDGVEHYRTLYARALLDHRISTENVVYRGPPDDDLDFGHFDATYGDLLGGTAPTRLAGARLTTVRLRTKDPIWVAAWREHFTLKGWTATLYDYTCDEPPNGCSFSSIPDKAAPIQAGGVATLVTTSLSKASQSGVLDAIDILVPIIGATSPVLPGSAYANWLAGDPMRQLWWYQSCESHGCGSGCGDGSQKSGYPPSYVIDALAVQARAMEWLTFTHGIGGELYFATVHQLATAWDDQCAFDGAGDGTLLYPGTPARIGGTKHIPVTSIRLALIREGLEDYEYLHLLKQLGDEAYARKIASELFADKGDVRVAPAALYQARTKLADRIDQLSK